MNAYLLCAYLDCVITLKKLVTKVIKIRKPSKQLKQ